MQSCLVQSIHTNNNHENHEPFLRSQNIENHNQPTNYEFKIIKKHTTRIPAPHPLK